MSEIEKDLGNTSGDYLHSIAKAGLAAIPIIGGGASELFSLLIAPPLSKRRDAWLIRLAEGIDELRETISEFQIESLIDNEIFVTTVLQATQAALRNHHEEKLTALRNAVLNSAVGIDIDESIQLMFLNLVDSMTPWHLRVLLLFQNPEKWFEDNQRQAPQFSMGSPKGVLESAFNELNGKRSFYDILVKDLNTQGLLGIDSLHTMMTGSGAMAPRTTDFGNLFISYITPPY
ncbi:hypothetical protein NST99_20415 [Paenibacillus sp. FSL L8-0470]|uniref:hypothetical protein n=1 Tax=Paenibacillus sp. FSL L8-0470 TaxID=2954688 RepID=UPI0030FC448B